MPGVPSEQPDRRRLDLHVGLHQALRGGERDLEALAGARPAGPRDAVLALLEIHDLHLSPPATLAGAERWQNHPVVARLKWELEHELLGAVRAQDARRRWELPGDPAAALRAIASIDKVPPVYRWLAEHATLEELKVFLALEGGPDGGFDDLVAICQVGLAGAAKMELARNYWDEMGRGDPLRVHTELHRRLSFALELTPLPRRALPLPALRRTALGGVLATNRALQAEMVGALGLIELQAGPRCRQVVAALRRLGAPPSALAFYEEHAAADPLHGKRWLDDVVGTLGAGDGAIAPHIVRGARWRSTLNGRFLSTVASMLGAPSELEPAAPLPAAVP